MEGFQLVTQLGDQISYIGLSTAQRIQVVQGSTYRLIDSTTKASIAVTRVRSGDSLEIWKDDEFLVVFEGYFADGANVSFEQDENSTLVADYPADDSVQSDDLAVGAGGMSWLATAGYVAGGSLALVALANRDGGNGSGGSNKSAITITPLAGPFVADSSVKIYDASGNVLGSGSIDEATGQVTVSVDSNYIGPALVVVMDTNDSAADYLSEVTSEGTSLGGSLRAMINITGDGDISLSVTPLTELATQMAGVPTEISALSTSPLTDEQVSLNDSIAALFELTDILGDAITILDSRFSDTDGLSGAEQYGDMLAILSGLEANLGGMQAAIEALAAEITLAEGVAVLSAEGAALLQSAWLTFEAGVNGDAIQSQSFVAGLPLIAEADPVLLVVDAQDGTVLQLSGVEEGDRLRISLGDSQMETTVTSEMLEDQIAGIPLGYRFLQSAGDGTFELVVQVNDETPRQPVLIQQDLSRPGVIISIASDQLNIGGDVLVTFIMSEPVEGFGLEDIQVENGTLADLRAAGDGLTWTALYTPDEGVENAIANISVLPGFTDLLGNAPASFSHGDSGVAYAAQSGLNLDTSRPSAQITLEDTNLAAGETTTVYFTFSEPVYDLRSEDVVVESGTLTFFASSDGGTKANAVFKAEDGVESANNQISLNLSWTDALGNQPLVIYSSEPYLVDSLAPVITNASQYFLTEATGENQTVLTVSATDLQAVTWFLAGGHVSYFSYNAETGAVKLLEDPDYETLTSYQFTLVATDVSGNRSSQNVVLEILDIDDTAPIFLSGDQAD
ncbi:MAG: Ig-like domain-containing protein, partial [Oceanobacter sp.]